MRIIRFLIFYVLVSVLGILALIFFGLNHYNVQIDLLEAQYTVSVAWVMAGAALFGFIVSMLLLGPGRLAAGWNSRALDREVRDLEGLLERREELRARLLAQHEALLERHERILLRHQALLDEHSHVIAERDEAVAQLAAARNARPAIAAPHGAGASGAATALRLLPQPKPQPQPQAQPQPQPQAQPQTQPKPASEPAATMPARVADPVPAAQVAQRTGIAAPASIERPVAQPPVRPVAAQPAATVAPAPAPAPATVPVVSTSSPPSSPPMPASSPAASSSPANQPPAGKITRITEVTETPAPVAASVASQPQPQPQPQAAHEAQPRQRPRRDPVLPKLRARAVHAREATAASVTRLGQRTQRGATNLRDTSGAWLTAQRDVQRERLTRLRQRLASLRPDAE